MKQNNIDTMDKIVDLLNEGKTISEALAAVYTKRKVEIPYNQDNMNISIDVLKLSNRTQHALTNIQLTTISDVVDYVNQNGVKNIKSMGVKSCTELFEKLLDYLWTKMSTDDRVAFLIDAVERNEIYLK